jgi:hypothetical protein
MGSTSDITTGVGSALRLRYGDDLYLTFIDPTPDDKAARTTEMQASVASMPIMTQNEARRSYLGLGPIDGEDQLMMPGTMIAAGTSAKPEGEDQTPQLAKSMTATGRMAKTYRTRTGGKTAHSGARKARLALTEAFKKALDQQEPAYVTKKVTDLTHSEYMEHWKRFANRSEQAEAELKAVFKGINTKQREVVLENLPDATGVTKALDELFNTDEWISIVIDLATPILTSLAKDEAIAALAMIGAGQRDILGDAGTRAALERGIAKMAKSYNETTMSQLEKVLADKLN